MEKKVKEVFVIVLNIILFPLSLILMVIAISLPLIGIYAVMWAIGNWRISLPIIVVGFIGLTCFTKLRDFYETKKWKREKELERQAACEFCKDHPNIKHPIKHDIFPFRGFCKSYFNWDKYGRAYIRSKGGEQPSVVIYDIVKEIKSSFGGYAKKSIDSYEVPIFSMESNYVDEVLVNLEDSDIIRIETLERQTHIFINPKLIPQEDVKKISKGLLEKAQAFCEGDKERDNSQKDSHKAFSLFQEAAQMGDAEAQCCLGCCYSNGYGIQVDNNKARYWYDKSSSNGCLRALFHVARIYENGQGVPQSYEKAVEWYTKAAEQGYARAQFNLGDCYYNGQGVPQSYEKAVEWYTKAAEQGYARAQFILGYCYHIGQGIPQSYEKAVEWYTKAAEQGYARAQFNLGYCYDKGQGVPQSYEKAVEWYTKAAEQGDARAQCNLGYCYQTGQGVPQSYEKAVKWYVKAAEQGHARAQYNLGVCYEKGIGVPKNYDNAKEWYTKAAEQGHTSAQFDIGFLGYLYYYGIGISQSYVKAADCYSKAAKSSFHMFADILYDLGYRYENGEGVPQSYERAVEWYTKAAEKGNARAQYNIGICYEKGRGVPQSYEKAVRWYAKAAEQGNASAQNNLGVCYEKGRGVPQSYEKAVELYTKAAEQGNASAQNNLGVCYEKGRGVPQSYEKAVELYTKAAEQGNASAQCNLGVCYEKSKGVPKSNEEIMKYTKAAEEGDARAQCILGFCYEYGQGVFKSYEKAKEWYSKAACQGYSIAKCNLGNLYEYGRGVPQNYEIAVCWYALSAIQGNAMAQYCLGRCLEKGIGISQSWDDAKYWYTKSAEQWNELAQKKLNELHKEVYGLHQNNKEDYNRDQQVAINLSNGHHLVLAPPGCGKTRVLAERVMHAVDNGVKVENMLCLTFTNRAAREMKERIDKRTGKGEVENLFVGNVHHFCTSLLRKNRVISQKTTVIDDEEKTVILREVIKNCLNFNVPNVEDYYNFQHLQYQLDHHHPDELITRPELKKYLVDERYIKVAREYLSYKKKYDLIDFEDLLLFGYDYLLSHKEEVNHYSWIQVDEVQDLNRLQIAIIELVTGKNPCVVYLGDEQQAIYSFMGAKLKTLTYLKEKCHGSIHHFFGNYRSPKYLLDVFNKYAEINLHVDREVLPQPQGENANMQKPKDGLLIESCEQREGFFNGDYCSYDMAVERSLSYADGRTAILTYTNANCDKISERLDRKGIEHFKISGTDFLWTKEVKLIFSHLNVFTQPENIMSWARILLGIDVYKKMEEAHQFISEANKCFLRGNDLMNDKLRNIIKNFIHDYPNELVIFDTETTGLDVNNDDIVEIAAIRIKGGIIVDEMDIMLYTEKTIPLMLGDTVNPLPDEYKKREKLQRDKGLLMFLDWVGKVPVLAHNAKYDYQILDANLKRDCGINNLPQRWQRVHDSLAIARIIEPQLSSYKLKDLLAIFHLSGNNSHLAIDDVKATKNLVDYCFQKASYIFVLQNDFFARNQVTINLMRERYGELYQHTWSLLSQKSGGVEGNIFSAEVNYAYQYFKDKDFIGELKKMNYLLPFLENDFIVDSKEKTLRQLLDQYMMELNTLRESDLCDSKSLRGRVNVYVSTVHRAKGLEFDNVVVFDVRDGAYPNFEWNNILKEKCNPAEIEKAQYGIQEDARKLYVAISRAKKRLCIQFPQMNTGHGRNGWYSFPAKLSPFIERICNMFAG